MANPSVGASHCAQASRDVLRAADQWPGQHHQHSRSSASSWFTSLITFNLQEYDLQLCSLVYTDMPVCQDHGSYLGLTLTRRLCNPGVA